MKAKWSVLSIFFVCALLFPQSLLAQGNNTTPFPPGSGVPTPGCGSVWKGAAFEENSVWTVPKGVEVVWVTGIGGGGGGGRDGGGGGGASSSHRVPAYVGGVTSVNIVVGLGGSSNKSGGTTKFGDFIVGRGGRAGGAGGGANGAGFHGDSIEGAMTASGAGGGSARNSSGRRVSGGNASGGKGGRYYGGGGASAFGSGGDGGGGVRSNGRGWGAGGGGSWGRGSNGFLIIEWSEPMAVPQE